MRSASSLSSRNTLTTVSMPTVLRRSTPMLMLRSGRTPTFLTLTPPTGKVPTTGRRSPRSTGSRKSTASRGSRTSRPRSPNTRHPLKRGTCKEGGFGKLKKAVLQLLVLGRVRGFGLDFISFFFHGF